MPRASGRGWSLRADWKAVATGLVGFAAAGLAGALLVAWLGLYNVAASTGHWALVELFLRFGMENSVKARASNEPPPRLDDPDLIRLGAGHFHGGCAYCHGAPGIRISPVAAGMLPSPPDLSQRVGRWRDQELFWIVKHGIKYAGMPAWPELRRDDEIWAVVAFLKRLPDLDEAGYRELAIGEVEVEPPAGQDLATGESVIEAAVSACARCHGAERGPPSRYVPILHGQPAERLLQATRDYASRERQSGIMQTVTVDLTEQSMARLARYYAGLPAPERERPALDPALVERGRRLAEEGEPANEIPACLGCHSPTRSPLYPRLAGQPAAYLAGQLHVWKTGLNDRSPTGAIMAPIARRLTGEQIEAVAAYFAGLPLPGEGGP